MPLAELIVLTLGLSGKTLFLSGDLNKVTRVRLPPAPQRRTMFYKETKWLDEETQQLVDRREEIINELIDIEMKLENIKGKPCQPNTIT